MQEENEYLNKQNNARMWTISLAASIMCCTVFSAVAFYFLSNLGQTLNSIDGRLANLETRNIASPLPNLPPSAAAVPVPEPEMPSAAPLQAEPASATMPDTVPAAPPPSNETPPATAAPQMSTPSQPASEELLVPAPPEPPALP